LGKFSFAEKIKHPEEMKYWRAGEKKDSPKNSSAIEIIVSEGTQEKVTFHY